MLAEKLWWVVTSLMKKEDSEWGTQKGLPKKASISPISVWRSQFHSWIQFTRLWFSYMAVDCAWSRATTNPSLIHSLHWLSTISSNHRQWCSNSRSSPFRSQLSAKLAGKQSKQWPRKQFKKPKPLTVDGQCDHFGEARSDAVAGRTEILAGVRFLNEVDQQWSVGQ